MATLALLASASSARAAERIVAIPQSTYATSNVAIDQGEPLTFLNLDLPNHDVVATDKGADGEPLFSTPLIGPGQEVPVEGATALGTGSYAFRCTIHPGMDGTLTVRDGGEGGAGAGKGPEVEVRVTDSKLSAVRRSGALGVELALDRSASVRLVASPAGGKGAALGKARREFDGSGTHELDIPLSKSGRKALRGKDKAKVTVSARAVDKAGNSATAKDGAKLD